MARRSTSSSRTVSQTPKVGDPTRMSTATSSTEPLAHMTYFAWPGGTSAKWMPRSTPAAETEQFACRRSNRWPATSWNGPPWKNSRKTPRGSPCWRGVISHAPGTDSSRYVIGDPSPQTRVVQQVEQVRPVPGLHELLRSLAQLVVGQEPASPGDFLRAADLQSLAVLDGANVVGSLEQRVEGPRVQPRGAAREDLDVEPALAEVFAVDVGDLVLAAGRWLEVPRDGHAVVVVEVQTRHRVAALRCGRLLLERQRPSGGIELDDAVRGWLRDPVGEHGAAVDLIEPRQGRAQPRAVEDVVAEHECRRVGADEARADDERLGEPVRFRLGGVADRDAELRPVTEQALELLGVVRRRDHQHVADPGQDQRRQRVVDHRLVVHRDELLAHADGDRVQPSPGAPGQDDSAQGAQVCRPRRTAGPRPGERYPRRARPTSS